ncbi:cupin domain-containing protein [Caldivirga sp. UBA161]|uniref:cupin domain-containing protein n=1 Tax=Caldivirga sp. UBA161 TaxID=1915569 RepID=UPI0025B9AD40|nr:cupin domain-containing protein [Caldivirga sp. UBA161]
MPLYRLGNMRGEEVNPLTIRRYINGERMTLAQFMFKRGAKVRRHAHINEQFSIILTGRLRFRINNEEYIAEAGDVVHIPSNMEHEVEALEDSMVIDVYSPIREDWLKGEDKYLR